MVDDAELGAFPGLTPTDRENLAGGDENFKPHNWEDLKGIIGIIYTDTSFKWTYLISRFLLSLSRQQSRNPEAQTVRSATLHQMDQPDQSHIWLYHHFYP